jgi:hypothetical protein
MQVSYFVPYFYPCFLSLVECFPITYFGNRVHLFFLSPYTPEFSIFLHFISFKLTVFLLGTGRAIAEAVSRWLPAAATRVRARVWQMGFVVDKVASWQVFS